jgi:hypothetical protein
MIDQDGFLRIIVISHDLHNWQICPAVLFQKPSRDFGWKRIKSSDFLVRPAANPEKLEFALVVAQKISERILVRFV